MPKKPNAEETKTSEGRWGRDKKKNLQRRRGGWFRTRAAQQKCLPETTSPPREAGASESAVTNMSNHTVMCGAQRPQGGGGAGAPRERHRAYCPRGGLPRTARPDDRPRGGDAPRASPPPPRPEGPLTPGCAVLRMVLRARGGGTSGSPRVVPRRGAPEGCAPRAVVFNRGEWRSRQGRGRSMQFGALTAA